MDSVEVYGFEDKDGTESTFTTRDIEEAKRFARENNLKLIAYVFEFADSEMIEDNTLGDSEDNSEDDTDEYIARDESPFDIFEGDDAD